MGAAQVLTDAHRSTRFAWARPHTLSSESTAAISWDIPASVRPGLFRHQSIAPDAVLCGWTVSELTLTRALRGVHLRACKQSARMPAGSLRVEAQELRHVGCWTSLGCLRVCLEF